MGLWSIVRHPRRYLDLLDAWKRLKKNWRNPEMLSKWRQREFYLSAVYSIIRMANDGFELGMSDETMNWVGATIIAAIFSIAAPKVAKAVKNGPK